MTKNGVVWEWSDMHQEAFDRLKVALTTDCLLMYPDFSKEFLVMTDASNDGFGATLSQVSPEGDIKPVAFAAQLINGAQRNYSTLNRP